MSAHLRDRTTKGPGGGQASKPGGKGGHGVSPQVASGGCRPPVWGKPGSSNFASLIKLWKRGFDHEKILTELEQRQRDQTNEDAVRRWRNVEDNIETIKNDFARVIEWLLDSSYHSPLSDFPVGSVIGKKVSNWEYFLWTMKSAANWSAYREYHRVSRKDARYFGMGVGPIHRSDFRFVDVHCKATGVSSAEFYLNMLGDSIYKYIPGTNKGHPFERGAFTMGTIRNYLPPWYKLLWSRYEWPTIMMAVLNPQFDQPADVLGK